MNSSPLLRVALAGNPNSGKTSLFNALTGARQHVANYPGVTVERRAGKLVLPNHSVELVDLPGTYSLTSYSVEEHIAQEHLLGTNHDVVVVVDSSSLRRSLPLLLRVIQKGANPVLCLNMADEARRAGQKLQVSRLEQLLGFPVVETVASRRVGLGDLKRAISRAVERPYRLDEPGLAPPLRQAVASVIEVLEREEAPVRGRTWAAVRLLADDEVFERRFLAEWPALDMAKAAAGVKRSLRGGNDCDRCSGCCTTVAGTCTPQSDSALVRLRVRRKDKSR